MRIFFFIALFLGMLGNALAQKDPNAKVILDKVSTTTKAYKTIDIGFTFELKNDEEGLEDLYEGKVQVKDLMYKLTMMGAETYFDGKTIYTYMVDAEEVNIDNPSESMDEMLNPSTLFTIYEDGFDYKLIGTKAGIATIELLPTDDSKNYKKVILAINVAKSQLTKAQLFSTDGNTYVITIKSFATNKEYEDSYFAFDKNKHPNVYVNDMR